MSPPDNANVSWILPLTGILSVTGLRVRVALKDPEILVLTGIGEAVTPGAIVPLEFREAVEGLVAVAAAASEAVGGAVDFDFGSPERGDGDSDGVVAVDASASKW
jgi:hypothetical protein